MNAKESYEYLVSYGLVYGPAFQSPQQISCIENREATAGVNAFQ